MRPQTTHLFRIRHTLWRHHHNALKDARDISQRKGIVRLGWRGQKDAHCLAIDADHCLCQALQKKKRWHMNMYRYLFNNNRKATWEGKMERMAIRTFLQNEVIKFAILILLCASAWHRAKMSSRRRTIGQRLYSHIAVVVVVVVGGGGEGGLWIGGTYTR